MSVAARRLLCGWGGGGGEKTPRRIKTVFVTWTERGGKSASVTTQRIVLVFILLGTSGGKDYTRVCR